MSPNLQEEGLETWIHETQLNEMRTFLGAELYKLMAEDWDEGAHEFQTTRFVTLWDGDDSGEVYFFGLWRPIGLFSISEIIRNNSFNVTRYSNTELDGDIEEPVQATAATAKASAAYSQGIKLLEEVREYMTENSDLYPEWDEPINPPRPSTFRYYRVPPNKPNLKHGF